MSTKAKTVGTLSILCLGAALASAQAPAPVGAGAPPSAGPGAAPADPVKFQVERMSGLLGLNEDQKAGFEKVLGEQRSQTETLQLQLRDRRQKLDELLKSETPEPATVGTLVIEQHRLMQKVQGMQEQASRSMRALLTPEQQAKFDAMKRHIPGRGMGPMGHPMGAPPASMMGPAPAPVPPPPADGRQ